MTILTSEQILDTVMNFDNLSTLERLEYLCQAIAPLMETEQSRGGNRELIMAALSEISRAAIAHGNFLNHKPRPGAH